MSSESFNFYKAAGESWFSKEHSRKVTEQTEITLVKGKVRTVPGENHGETPAFKTCL